MNKKYLCLDGLKRETTILTTLDFKLFDTTLLTKITHGHGVASKASAKYPDGTIALQYPVFKNIGFDIGHCFGGTLNLSISPLSYRIINPRLRLNNVDWFPARGKTENFLICDCAIKCANGFVAGYVYQPDPATKIEHYDDPNALQIISPFIEGLGEPVELSVSSEQILIDSN